MSEAKEEILPRPEPSPISLLRGSMETQAVGMLQAVLGLPLPGVCVEAEFPRQYLISARLCEGPPQQLRLKRCQEGLLGGRSVAEHLLRRRAVPNDD